MLCTGAYVFTKVTLV